MHMYAIIISLMQRHVSSIPNDVTWVANRIAHAGDITRPRYVAWGGAAEYARE